MAIEFKMIHVENYQLEILALEQMVEREPDKSIFDDWDIRRFGMSINEQGFWWLNYDWDVL